MSLLKFQTSLVLAALAASAAFVACGVPLAAQPLPAQPARADAHALHNMMLATARAGQRIVAVGSGGYVILSDDGGASYRQAARVPVDFTLTSVSFVDARHGWAAGHGGVILHTDDGGENWTLQRSDTSVDQPLFSIYFSDAGHGWAAGLWGLLLHTSDGGKTWEQVRLPAPAGEKRGDFNLLHIFSGQGDALYVAAEQGVLYRSADAGAHWQALATGSRASLWTGVANVDGTLVLGGLGGKLMRSTDGGQHWQQQDGGNGSITGMQADGARIVASTLSGALLQSDDGGANWRVIATARVPLTAMALVDGDAARPLVFGKGGVTRLEPAGSK